MSLLEQLEQQAENGECSMFKFCAEVAGLFRVRAHEVAVLELKKSVLRFVHPPELQKTGLIPLISSAQAAKTATSKRAEMFNNFTAVRHSSVFETVKVSGANAMTIQKLMSAPILSPTGEVVGVIQLSRKGNTQVDAGPDFDIADLQQLREVAKVLGRVADKLFDGEVKLPNAAATAATDADLRADA